MCSSGECKARDGICAGVAGCRCVGGRFGIGGSCFDPKIVRIELLISKFIIDWLKMSF